MKSSTASPANELVVTPFCLEWSHAGPTPTMNSAFGDRVHGFLNSRSTSHSVERRAKSGVTPASSSSQFSIGVTSTATSGPKLDTGFFKSRAAAAPSSTIAMDSGSVSACCARALPGQRTKQHATNPRLKPLILTGSAPLSHRVNPDPRVTASDFSAMLGKQRPCGEPRTDPARCPW